ncbi:MAG: lysoplasmalogenase [Verrucomicrobia bacterium]|nr:lysoplasmalogenase [Verrucomicrobiota bacterium]
MQGNRVKSYVCGLLAAWTGLCVATMLVRRALHLDTQARLLLMAASTGFVLIAAVGGAHRRNSGRFMLMGLIFCWLGDYLGPSFFLASLVAFLLAHVCFLAAFWSRGIEWGRFLASLGGLLLVGCGVGVWLLPHVTAELRPPVVIYMMVITLMVAFAVSVRAGNGRIVILLGAVLFYVSDLFVARWKFVSPDSINAFFCYPLYYAACVLLAFSVLLGQAGTNRTSELAGSLHQHRERET